MRETISCNFFKTRSPAPPAASASAPFTRRPLPTSPNNFSKSFRGSSSPSRISVISLSKLSWLCVSSILLCSQAGVVLFPLYRNSAFAIKSKRSKYPCRVLWSLSFGAGLLVSTAFNHKFLRMCCKSFFSCFSLPKTLRYASSTCPCTLLSPKDDEPSSSCCTDTSTACCRKLLVRSIEPHSFLLPWECQTSKELTAVVKRALLILTGDFKIMSKGSPPRKKLPILCRGVEVPALPSPSAPSMIFPICCVKRPFIDDSPLTYFWNCSWSAGLGGAPCRAVTPKFMAATVEEGPFEAAFNRGLSPSTMFCLVLLYEKRSLVACLLSSHALWRRCSSKWRGPKRGSAGTRASAASHI